MMKKLILQILYWIFQFLKYIVMILLIGTVMGSVFFPIFGKIFGDHTFLFLLKKGASVGFRYAGVWAVGSSIVICTMKAREQHLRKINSKKI